MSEFEAVIELSVDDLKLRRKQLEQELKKTVVKQVVADIKKEITESLVGVSVNIKEISWEFYPESDDEGGSVYYPEGVNITAREDIDPDEYMVDVKSAYSDDVYEYSLGDVVIDILCDKSSDLYEYDIYEIKF